MPILPTVAVVVNTKNQLAVSEKPNESVMQVNYFYTINSNIQTKKYYS
jgi:hypothetical protein